MSQILFVSAEVAPYSKAGGLADVAGGLPPALKAYKYNATNLSPLYGSINCQKFKLKETTISGTVYLGKDAYLYKIWSNDDESHWFVHNDEFFGRNGIYTDARGEGFPDNNLRFFFFQKVAVDLIKRAHINPKVVHCNDHHTALIPLMLKAVNENAATLLTVHNFQYQGWFSSDEFGLLTQDEQNLINPVATQHYNAMELGLHYAHHVNTVSPNYAKEILEIPDWSFGLFDKIQSIKDKFSGILNGVDYSYWNPQYDSHIEHRFDVENTFGKKLNKAALQVHCSWPVAPDTAVIGNISRLVDAKGYPLIIDILPDLMELDVQFVFLGTGMEAIQNKLREFTNAYPKKIAYFNGYDEPFAHLIEAGADLFLMPSAFEPCGLNQIYSLKYGTLPIVHETGGLADTVENWDGETGTGFSFNQHNSQALLETIVRAIQTYQDKKSREKLIQNAMKKDFSWSFAAKKYAALYKSLES